MSKRIIITSFSVLFLQRCKAGSGDKQNPWHTVFVKAHIFTVSDEQTLEKSLKLFCWLLGSSGEYDFV